MRLIRPFPALLCGLALLCGTMAFAQPQHLFKRYVNQGTSPAPGQKTSYAVESVRIPPNATFPDGGYLTVGSFNDNGISSAVVEFSNYNQFISEWVVKLTLNGSTNPSFNIYGTAVCIVGGDYYVGVTALIGGTFYKYMIRLDDFGNQVWTVYLGRGIIDKMKHNPVTNEIVVLAEENGMAYTAGVNRNSGALVWALSHDPFHSYNRYGTFTAGDLEVDPTTGNFVIVGTVRNSINNDKNIVVGHCNSAGFVLWMNQYGDPNLDEEGKGVAIGTSSSGTGPYTYRIVANKGQDELISLEVDPNNMGTILSAFEYVEPGVTLRVDDVAFDDQNIPLGSAALGIYTMAGWSRGLFGTSDQDATFMRFHETGYPPDEMYHYSGGPNSQTNDRFFDVKADGDQWVLTGTQTPIAGGFAPGVFLLRTDVWGEEPALASCRKDQDPMVNPISLLTNDQFENGFPFTQALLSFPSFNIAEQSNSGCGNHSFKQGVAEETRETSSQDFTVFPNPAQDQITVAFDQPAFGQLRLLDMQGRVHQVENLFGQPALQLELSHLSKGIYLLEWQEGDVAHHRKVVVE